MHSDFLDRVTLTYVINLLQQDAECMDDEQDYALMQQDLLMDTEHFLQKRLSDEEISVILENMQNYGAARERETLQIGIKMGMKLMKELNKL